MDLGDLHMKAEQRYPFVETSRMPKPLLFGATNLYYIQRETQNKNRSILRIYYQI
jgi:hypothetical protein